MIGTGGQARFQIDALSRVRSFEEVRVWGRDPERAGAAAGDIAALPSLPDGCAVTAAASVREAVDGRRRRDHGDGEPRAAAARRMARRRART